MNEELRKNIMYAIVDALIDSDDFDLVGHTGEGWNPLFYYKGKEYIINFEEVRK